MTPPTARHLFRTTVAQVADKAKATLPAQVNGRIDAAVRLVVHGDVETLADGSMKVGGSDPTRWYHLVGTACTCTDFTQGKAPDGWCKHRIAAGIQKRVQALLAEPAAPVVPEVLPEAWPDNDPEEPAAPACPGVPVPAAPGHLDPRHIVLIQGKPFVKFAGLLDLAHQRGLQALTVAWTYNDADLSLAHAVAIFSFGRFEDSGDATPANVTSKVAPHFRRCALTRAAARVLRHALNCDLVALEELGESHDD